jgi:site-specific recombinase XerD
VKLTAAIDLFIDGMRDQGRINSAVSERSYRDTLYLHAEDVQNRDPRYTNRDDVKRTLSRWPQPNTKSKRRSYLVSFYRYLMEEGLRKDNPAEQTPRPKRRPVSVYRLTFEETVKVLRAAKTTRERRAIFLCVCAGLRSQEVRGMQGRHFQRKGWIWVSEDIAKGGRERWVPMVADLGPVVEEIVRHVGFEDFILPALRAGNPGVNTRQVELPQRPCSQQSLGDLVGTVGRRAGIAAHIYPHLLRHAFADHLARFAGMRNAQFLLGHSSISTTEGYLGKPTMAELEAAVGGFSFGADRTDVLGSPGMALQPAYAPGGIRTPDLSASAPRAAQGFAPVLQRLFASPVLRAAARGLL